MSDQLGLSIASHSGLPPGRIGALARAAELAGFSAVFVAEGHGDALSLCHPVAAATQAVRVGTAIANAALGPPVLAAKTAAQLDQAAGGRFVLGLGVANPVMNARFGIQPFAPLPMIEEYVGVVRAVLRGQAGGYDGQVFRTGMVPLDNPPVRPDLPVYLAALGPRMLELAGRIADGVILNLMTPAQAGQAASAVRAAGRDPEIACVVYCCLSEDPAAAAEWTCRSCSRSPSTATGATSRPSRRCGHLAQRRPDRAVRRGQPEGAARPAPGGPAGAVRLAVVHARVCSAIHFCTQSRQNSLPSMSCITMHDSS
jgi:alkanesulfonate monooxygenase SsuD/methylene tetrahydromethanopterin reductase-like flavin-dependent oxidoreductase (luciferase family)